MTRDEQLLVAEVCLDTLIASHNDPSDHNEQTDNSAQHIDDDEMKVELAVVTLHRVFTIWSLSRTPRLTENSATATRENDHPASAAATAAGATNASSAANAAGGGNNGVASASLQSPSTFSCTHSNARELIQDLRQSWILVGYTVVLATKKTSDSPPLAVIGNPPHATTGNVQPSQHQQQQQQHHQQQRGAILVSPSSKRARTPLPPTELNLTSRAALHLDIGIGPQTQDRLFEYLRTQLHSLDICGSRSSRSCGGGGGGASANSMMTIPLPHRSSSWSCISETQVALQVDIPYQYTLAIHPLTPLEPTLSIHPINNHYHTSSQHTLSTHLLKTPSQHTHSTHTYHLRYHTPCQYTPLNPHFLTTFVTTAIVDSHRPEGVEIGEGMGPAEAHHLCRWLSEYLRWYQQQPPKQ